MTVGISIVLIITSLLMIVLVLLHRGKGGGLSDLFGGGVTSSLGSSSVVERNLDRLTIFTGHHLVRLHRRPRHRQQVAPGAGEPQAPRPPAQA